MWHLLRTLTSLEEFRRQRMELFQTQEDLLQDHCEEEIREIPLAVSSKDPTGAPIVSKLLTVGRSGGISARELLECIQSVTRVLAGGEGTK